MKEFRGGMSMNDIIEKIGKASYIQHGKLNDRIYLMKLSNEDAELILDEISELATKNAYSKVFCKVSKSVAPVFFARGFLLEAYIPDFYKGKEDVFFLSKFLNSDRLLNIETKKLNILSELLDNSSSKKSAVKNASEYRLRKLTESDVEQITELYSLVFKSYPFPIYDPEYILKTMKQNIIYFGAEQEGKIVALASSEIDFEGRNAEMTDFATHKEHTGKHLSVRLLEAMEQEMKKQGIQTLYTIARLNSIPMNKTFLRADYEYSGTLIMNTNIAGRIESMNVYYKHI